MDVLADVLTTLRLRGTVYFQSDFGAPWGMYIKAGPVANFHLVVKGRCWLRGPGQGNMRELRQGDLVVLAHGDGHALLHRPDASAPPADAVIGDDKKRSQSPQYGGEGEITRLICGHYEYERAGRHPLLRALPPLIHLTGDQQTEMIATASQLVVTESNSLEKGSGAIVDRLAEILFIQVVRGYAALLPEEQGFLAALAEPAMATALVLLHEQPARDWRLEDLARDCGVSRTKLGERFKQTLGIAPMQYLTEWRMHKARELLTSDNASIAQVAASVGYSSEFSFSKAYKRVFGETPGSVRAA
tara:strand:- start:97442 stop:98347 length:906 start_codon:yes stop_codon:yes gene_type:complete